MNANLATASLGDDTSSAPLPQQHVPEQHDLQGTQGQYTYSSSSISEFYSSDGRSQLSMGNVSGVPAALYNSFADAPLDTANINVQQFAAFA